MLLETVEVMGESSIYVDTGFDTNIVVVLLFCGHGYCGCFWFDHVLVSGSLSFE